MHGALYGGWNGVSYKTIAGHIQTSRCDVVATIITKYWRMSSILMNDKMTIYHVGFHKGKSTEKW